MFGCFIRVDKVVDKKFSVEEIVFKNFFFFVEVLKIVMDFLFFGVLWYMSEVRFCCVY